MAKNIDKKAMTENEETHSFPIVDDGISIGKNCKFPLDAFLRHCAIIGSSGSGKTVTAKMLCEEFAMRGIPIIAIDPQGDIASLIQAGKKAAITKHKGNLEQYKLFNENVDVVVWTPTSSAGTPIYLNPLKFDFPENDANEKIRAVTAIAQSLADLLGYDLKKDEGKYVSSFFDLVITHISDAGHSIASIAQFIKYLKNMPPELERETSDILPGNKFDEVVRKLRTLTIGSRKLLFSQGIPLDIEVLLGLERIPEDGKPLPTRISVIYLNTLSTQEEKNFFVAQIATALYNWMLKNPSKHLQAMFYIDEISPFLPPVRKPASRDILRLLFKQARKYGISCVLATQNPGDVDYRSLSQVSTYFLGRLMTDQDIKKVNQMIKALAGAKTDLIISKLPSLKAGNFIVLSPDNLSDVEQVKIRWLYSEHKTLDENDLENIVQEEQKEYFEELKPSLIPVEETLSKIDEKPEKLPDNAESETADESTTSSIINSKPVIEIASNRQETEKTSVDEYLFDSVQAFTQDELAANLEMPKRRIVKALKELEIDGQIQKAKEGRKNVYFSAKYKFHQKLGLIEQMTVAMHQISEVEAYQEAEKHINTTMLIVKTEEIMGCKLEYFPLWQCGFKGVKKEGFLFFRRSIPVKDNIYMHPTKGQICLATRKGLVFVRAPKESDPLDIKDLDDFVTLKTQPIENKKLTEWVLNQLLSRKEVEYQFDLKFNIKPRKIDIIFIPLWKFTFKRISDKQTREVFIDGILGKRFQPEACERFEP
ncbi:MAG: ATP-binding protein [Planctomycetes bacterium]|nr:ATP-binding protein [Planctomycetota bacterium]